MTQWARLRSVLDAVHVPQNFGAWVDALPDQAGVAVISFVNAHGFNMSAKDADFSEALTGSDILLRDGSGMKILMKMMDKNPGENLNGTDLIPQIVERFAREKAPIAFMGTAEPWLSIAAQAIRNEGGDIRLVEDGFQPEQHYVDCLTSTPCRLVVLGMGMPKQERVSMMIRDKLTGPMVVVNGGAVLDFLAGHVTRAPKWMRSLGMEWLYRLFKEPKRLFRRYVIGNFQFLWRALRLKFGAA